MNESQITPGVRLNEYEVMGRLGAGGMGEVYLARDLRLERQVALKILHAATQADQERVERFATEARAASALNHPNVAHVYGIGQAGPYCFIAMEYVQGETLRQAKLDLETLVDVAMQAAGALEAAHGAGIVHRDIKPANIMRTSSGLVKVLDFGLAKRISTGGPASGAGLTQPGIVMGTLGYMSPEQLLGRDVDHRTDIFSLGVVLYELMTGKLPFVSDSYQAALAELTSGGKAAALPGKNALARIVARCIERDADKRYQTAAELVAALRALKHGHTGKSSRREWIAAAGVVIAGAGFAGWRFGDFSPQESGPVNSLAVLPFTADAKASDVEYLSEGIAESLMNRLSSVTGLRVMSRDSAFRHRGQPAADAGRKLRVRGVVTGAIRKLDGALLVNAEFVDSANGDRLWGGEFRGSDSDVLSFRDRMAAAIAHKLEMKLGAPETEHAKAHDLYLRGRFQATRVDSSQVEEGIGYYQQAIELDPDYALAYAGLAQAHLFRSDLFVPATEALPKARQAAQSAVDIDPNLAEGHMVLAMTKLQGDLDWSGAEAGLRKAIERNPNLAEAHAWLGWLLSASGRKEDGIASSRRAATLEARSPLTHGLLAANLYFSGDYGASFEEAGTALDIDPQFHLALYWRASSMIARGMPGLVAGKLESVRQTNSAALVTALLGRAYAAADKPEKARQMLSELESAARTQHVSAIFFAALNAALHDDAATLDWLEKAYETRARLIMWLARDPAYAHLRKHERFQALMTRMKLS